MRISLARQRVEPFTERQIELVRTFADQAVIAMENTRLIAETREALEQQTATAEVLQVINSSPGDLAPVFDAILEKAHSLCGAVSGHLMTWDGECFETMAIHGGMGGIPIGISLRPKTGFILDRVARGETVIHVTDVFADPAYHASPYFREVVEIGRVRTMLYVALRKEDALLGVIGIYNRAERPFTDKQIALLQNFAAQAVIAMENARLLTETREALDQQTATAEVLQVINSSPGDLVPVFDAMLERAMRLCGAAFGQFHSFDGERFHTAALRGMPPRYAEYRGQTEPSYGPGTGPARILGGERVVHVADMADSEAYRSGDAARRALVDLGGCRTLLCVGLCRDERLLGAVSLYRQEVRLFSDKQIALLENFAAQAVIAMENARLLTETREALEQQTATAEVLQVINSSPGELSPVFDAILEKAHTLCGAPLGSLVICDGEYLRPIVAPAARIKRRTALPLWLSRLSMTTISPELKVGTKNCST